MRVAILGNSGSGKSTLARRLALESVPMLDLDTIVWEPGQVAVPRDRAVAHDDLRAFCDASDDWVIEGCYGDLVAAALAWRPELILLDPGEEACLRNCRSRPWEPHKYASSEGQDEHLPFLLEWAAGYYHREGPLSLAGHVDVFEAYDGPKRRIDVV